ncbi:ABC transporter ATP-binding protein [candidate division CSSED10-310 bacterium]|uniref:ABC transporter ATP-binding protein n=1 Tax=candidate division CSSED10-310 bacterium TaxID=2855610 RepID=A0ABV6YX51_UNCC1
MLDLLNISHVYPTSAWQLQEISLQLQAGEMLGLIGPNGSGKSTILRIAAGLMKADCGQVLLDKKSIYAYTRRAVACLLGYLPQKVVSEFNYAAREVVSMGRFPHHQGIGFLSVRDKNIIAQALEQTEITSLAERPFNQLSGGEQQRVLLASVLAQQPRLLLLDEPTTALDIHHKSKFFSLLKELAFKGLGIMVVTHELNLASLYCTKLIMLDGGFKVSEGTADQVLSKENIEHIYGDAVRCSRHPDNDLPIVLPARKE